MKLCRIDKHFTLDIKNIWEQMFVNPEVKVHVY